MANKQCQTQFFFRSGSHIKVCTLAAILDIPTYKDNGTHQYTQIIIKRRSLGNSNRKLSQ